MLVENADVSLVLEGYLWGSVFHPSYTSHWVSRSRGEPCMLGQGAVLECRGPACLPACEQLLARGWPSAVPSAESGPTLRGVGREQGQRDTVAPGLSHSVSKHPPA